MTTIRAILDNYAALCRCCDGFFASLRRVYKGAIMCAPGCFACCELHSVCALEAYALATHLAGRPVATEAAPRKRAMCALLRNGECSAYPARPVICRTHGVALHADNGTTVLPSCDRNFIDVELASLRPQHVFDTAKATNNLLRLNMAFCMAAGIRRLSSKRFTMEQVAKGKVPPSIVAVKA
jgi:Fe-S-cluster containining protein